MTWVSEAATCIIFYRSISLSNSIYHHNNSFSLHIVLIDIQLISISIPDTCISTKKVQMCHSVSAFLSQASSFLLKGKMLRFLTIVTIIAVVSADSSESIGTKKHHHGHGGNYGGYNGYNGYSNPYYYGGYNGYPYGGYNPYYGGNTQTNPLLGLLGPLLAGGLGGAVGGLAGPAVLPTTAVTGNTGTLPIRTE